MSRSCERPGGWEARTNFMNADNLNNAIGHSYVALAAVTLAALAVALTVWAARPLPDGLCSDGSVHTHAHATTYAHP